MLASGLYFKYVSDTKFVPITKFNSELSDYETAKRKLTLTDVAPAFIFLLTGCFVSILVLITEIWLSRQQEHKEQDFDQVPPKKKKKENVQ